MTPESTEPRTAAQMVIKKTISDMAENSIYDGIPAQLYAEEIMDVLEQHGYTIAPTEPGRVEISEDTAQTCADLIEVQRRFLGGRRVVPVLEHAHTDLTNGLRAAAERAATGGA